MTAVSPEVEDQLFALLLDPATMAEHITLPDEYPHDKQGRILVSRDGLRQFLHRRLWERVTGVKMDRRTFMLPFCDQWGCVNPTHFTDHATPYLRLSKCRNGHYYTSRDYTRKGTYQCQKCKAARALRRNTGRPTHHEVEAARTSCPYGHEYTPENTYRWQDARGSIHRKCRACALIRKAGGDPASDVGGV
jgi:hypothetical protein